MIAVSQQGHKPTRAEPTCGGAAVLDLALCLILSVTVVGLLLLAL